MRKARCEQVDQTQQKTSNTSREVHQTQKKTRNARCIEVDQTGDLLYNLCDEGERTLRYHGEYIAIPRGHNANHRKSLRE